MPQSADGTVHIHVLVKAMVEWKIEYNIKEMAALQNSAALQKAFDTCFYQGLLLKSRMTAKLNKPHGINHYVAVQITHPEVTALETYMKETIELAFKGKDAFIKGYPAIEDKAAAAMERDHEFMEKVRLIGNIIVTALASISVVGLVAMAATSKQRGGFLLFRNPAETDLRTLSAGLRETNWEMKS